MPGVERNACILPTYVHDIRSSPSCSYTTEIITMETIGSMQHTHTHTAPLSSARPSRCLSSWLAHPSFLQRLLHLDTHLVFLFLFSNTARLHTHPSSFFCLVCVSHPSCASLSLTHSTQPHACGHSSGTRLSARHLLSCLLRLAPWTPKSSYCIPDGSTYNPTPSSVKPVSAADYSG